MTVLGFTFEHGKSKGVRRQIPKVSKTHDGKIHWCDVEDFTPGNGDGIQEQCKPDGRTDIASPTRRSALGKMVAMTTIGTPFPALATSPTGTLIPTPAFTSDLSWPLGKVAFSLLPLAGTSSRRATVEECIVPDTIWTHDQIQGVVNVNVPVRQTVIRLKSGGLWVHNPVAPTPQLLQMMKKLEDRYGPVHHIVLGTVALEHKATFGAFCQRFPRATVWVQPGQWSFPVNLSIDYLGVNQRGAKFRELPFPGKVPSKNFQMKKAYPEPDWQNEIEYDVLGPFYFVSLTKIRISVPILKVIHHSSCEIFWFHFA